MTESVTACPTSPVPGVEKFPIFDCSTATQSVTLVYTADLPGLYFKQKRPYICYYWMTENVSEKFK